MDKLTIVLANLDGVELDQQTAGLGIPYSQRRFSHRNIVFPLEVVSGDTMELLIRIESGNALQFPLVIWERESFLENDHNEQFIFGMFYGILLVMLLYNLFIYLGVREQSYLDYVLFIFAITLVQLDVNKYSFEYLWPESPWWSMRSVPVLVSFTVVTAVRFVINFLNTKQYAPGPGTFLKWCAYLSVPGLVIPLFAPHKIAAAYCLGLAGIGAGALLGTTAYVARKGYQPAGFFSSPGELFFRERWLLFSEFRYSAGFVLHDLRTSNWYRAGCTLALLLTGRSYSNHERGEEAGRKRGHALTDGGSAAGGRIHTGSRVSFWPISPTSFARP